jgi:CO/xanthine dehydrogenase Mo-binding subunit
MRGFGVTSVSFATELHVSRTAEVLGLDPFELRLRNANRIGDTSPNWISYTDPSTVPTILAIADAVGHELPGGYGSMSREAREGDLLPEHLVAQQKLNGGGH